ncbi:hypothetical protein GGI23_004414 [Coemansia sp. RSA 2559]|nr:hypothetical protein GGI23_004414 [Coemansia sp. RSA 2559]
MAFTYFRDLNERLRQPGGPPFYFRIANLVVAVLMIVMAIVFFTWGEFGRIMLGIFEIVFAIWMVMFELAELAWLTPLVQFMFTWRGRGIFYVFIGCLTLGYRTVGWIFGAIIIAIGVVYIVLSFTSKRNESYVDSAAKNQGISSDTMYYHNSANVQKAGSFAGMYGPSGGGGGAQYAGDQSQYGAQSMHSGYGQPQVPQPAQRIQPQYPTGEYASQAGFDRPTYKAEARTDHLHSPI